MIHITRLTIALALTCQALALPLAGKSFAAEETRRLCDRQVTYDVVPPVDLPAELSRFSGVWKGTVAFPGGGEMCVAMVVKKMFPDGRVILLVAWNVGIGGREDINNIVGLGEAPNWPNKIENGELRIDSGTKWNGRHYYYVLNPPTDARPDVMEGRFMADNDAQPVVLYRERGR